MILCGFMLRNMEDIVVVFCGLCECDDITDSMECEDVVCEYLIVGFCVDLAI